ncbi:alkaline phosphatase family protein [Paraglaciecola sp. 2405UD69-4]|uniref:alkaline phosphatase family protein n=1 Tax=Paraglaciecola sp. 2405UD69-4 TaxID=3391836 RepID=UPI0039C8D3D6
MFKVLCILGLLVSSIAKANHEQPIVLMIGIDGLRADSLERAFAPNLQMLAEQGVRANMYPAMPSKTFVNFYSLATGLHPEHHGMVSNYPYDRKLSETFNRSLHTRDPNWWQGEPIWITAEKQGVISATYFWVGSEVSIDNIAPTYWKPFNQGKDYAERVTEVLGWLALPSNERPRLVTLYFSAVDTAAHVYGVGSAQELAAIKKVDHHIGELMSGLKALGLYDDVNLVVVSDHGMANLSDDRVVNLDKWIDLSPFIVPDWSKSSDTVYAPFLNLYGNKAEIAGAVVKLTDKHPNMKVLRRGAFPKDYHFDHPDRGPDLMLLADVGWTLYASKSKQAPTSFKGSSRSIATHGYDNKHPLMQATFIASGKAFKKGFEAKPFDNIEVYNMLSCILDLQPAKNDGQIKNIQAMLTKKCD